MKIKRAIPPAAAPIYWKDICHGLAGLFFGKSYMRRLEEELREYFKVRHVFLVSSGKAALTLILLALKSLKPDKKEVLIPAYTCFSVPSAIIKAGLKVSLCDIDPSNFDFDYELLAEAIGEDTLCVIPNHLFGIPANIDRINSFCKDKGIFVVEDAAQAMGIKLNGKFLGTIGDVGFFSLGRGKNITCGSGGIIVTNSDQIAGAISKQYSDIQDPGAIESFKDFLKIMLMAIFIHPSLYWFPSGLTFLKLGETVFYKDFPLKRFSGMKTGLLNNWRKRLEESNKIRKENAQYFIDRLRLRFRLRHSNSNTDSVPFLRLPVLLEHEEIRDKLYPISHKLGLGLSKMYPTSVNEIEEIKSQFNGMVFPSAKEVAECLLTIPTHQLLSTKDKEKICYWLSATSSQLKAESCTFTSKSVPICHSHNPVLDTGASEIRSPLERGEGVCQERFRTCPDKSETLCGTSRMTDKRLKTKKKPLQQ